jgi:uncharacterized protein (UPF0276 family)
MASFATRVQQLPTLGLGISTEYGASTAPYALDILTLRAEHETYAGFLEVGVEVIKGLDGLAQYWVREGWPTTYHFLDVNLDEVEDFDAPWLKSVAEIAARLQPAWMCGDAGLWHFGRRERGHMLLLPPILSAEAARGQAEGVVRMRDTFGYEVLPENPPGHVFLGDLHILDFYAQVADLADTGLLLDCAHLAIYQRLRGHDPLTGLDGLPLDRVVELHVAGSTPHEHEGFTYWEDDHTPEMLAETWTIFDWLAPRLPNLKAVVFECERNPLHTVLAGFERLAATLEGSALHDATGP